jgi:hypothetical protein
VRYQRSAHHTRFIANPWLLLHRGGIDLGHDPMCKHAAAECKVRRSHGFFYPAYY